MLGADKRSVVGLVLEVVVGFQEGPVLGVKFGTFVGAVESRVIVAVGG